jgi:TP901 family phage tail tape measure protein
MADVNANIGVNIDTSAALAQLKSLQRQISQFHTSISKSSESAAIAQKSLQKNLLSSINSIGAFSAELRTVKTSAESFTSSLEGNKFSMREYFRYAGASTKTFGRLFKSEFDTIGKVAEERVKTLQTQYIKMGRNASGAMEAIAIRPTSLNMQDYGTRTAVAAQKQALFNQLMKQGSTNLLNFGKNTQWAGRQLMVGFTIPLTVVGSAAAKTFMDMEAQAIKFKKVYGDLFTPEEETKAALDNITELGKSFTKYGIAVSQTVGVAAEAAAAGFAGLDLQRQTEQSIRLSILGQVDYQKALETTISVQNAFGTSSDELGASIDFLNAVENQTVLSLDDVTTAIPKSAPIIQQLGGDIKDLAFFMTAMKEGGINASEGANALKSGLASMINPTGKAVELLQSFGINVRKIVVDNKGDLKKTVIDFATALNQLDPLNRAQAIEQMFGKFQFARLSTLFANVTKEGNQASRVLDLANSSVEELASLSEKELGMTAESSMNKFKKTVEDLKVALIPVGQAFLEAVTPILEFVGNILEKFGNLSGGTKKVITLITLGIAGLAPVFLMTFGLLANLLANAMKGAMILRNGYLRLTGQSQILGDQTQYLTMEQLDATAAAHSLDQSHAKLTQQFTAEASAVAQLIAAYQQATVAGQKFMLNNPGMMIPSRGVKKLASGIVSVPGPKGAGDIVPAMLSPGEAVIPAKFAKKYAPLIQGMVAGNIPGYNGGLAYGGKTYSNLSGNQDAVNAVIAKFSNDVTRITAVFDMLERETAQTGSAMKITADGLKKMFVTSGVQRNNPKGTSVTVYKGQEYMAAHGKAPTEITDIKRMQEIADATVSKTLKEDLQATIKKEGKALGFSNLVFPTPASANKRGEDGNLQMGRDEMSSLFSGPEASRTLSPVYKSWLDTNQKTIKDVFNDPALAQEMQTSVGGFGNLIAEEISKLPANFGESDFYDAVAKAVARIDEADTRLKQAVDEMASTTMLGVDNPRSGRQQERRSIGVKDQEVRNILGTPEGIKSYKDVSNKAFLELGDQVEINKQLKSIQQKTSVDLNKVYGQLSQEAKARVMDLLGDVEAMSQQLMIEAQDAGIDLGKNSIKGITKGIEAGSPSKAAKREGQKVVDGFEQGILEGMDDAVTAGSQVGKATTQSLSRGASTGTITPGQPYNIQKTQGGIPFSQVARGMPATPDITKKAVEQSRAMQISTDRLRSFDRNIMGASFAISSLSGLASMSGGKFGSMAGAIAKVTGAMFALQAITGLLTQTKLLELAQSRLGLAQGALISAKESASVAGAAGKSGLLGSLARVGMGLKVFLGPIGIATTVATGLYVGFRLLQKNQEEARLKIEGLGNAALLTSEQLGKLGPILGFTPGPDPFANIGQETKVVSDPQRQKMDEIGTLLKEDKKFQEDIKSLKDATNAQAKDVVSAQAISLLAQGAPKENVQAYIDKLLEEAGKSKIDFKVESIDISSKKGQKEIVKNAKKQANKFAKSYAYSLKQTYAKSERDLIGGRDALRTQEQKDDYDRKNMAKSTQKQLKLFTKSQVASFGAIKKSLETGKIGVEAYNTAMSGLTDNLKSGNGNLLVAKETIKAMALVGKDKNLANAAEGITKNADAILVLEAATAGIPDMVKLINALNIVSSGTGTQKEIDEALARIAKTRADIAKRTAEQAEASKVEVNNFIDDGDTETKTATALSNMQDKIKSIREQAKAYNILRAAGVNAKTASDMASDSLIAADVAAGKIKAGTGEWAKLVKKLQAAEKQANNVGIALGAATALDNLKQQTKDINIQSQAYSRLVKAGFDAKEAEELVNNVDMANLINNPKLATLNFKQLKTAIDKNFKSLSNFDVVKDPFANVKKSIEAFSQEFDKAMEHFRIQEAQISQRFNPLVEKYKKAVDEIQDKINEINKNAEVALKPLNDESAILSNSLSIIDNQSKKINEKYDLQASALQKISDINSEIASQQKQQLTLADALSQGDISAAAAAAQDMRASAAQNALGQQTGSIEAARKKELDALLINGMTRAQIEERQYDISQLTYKIEQKRNKELDAQNIKLEAAQKIYDDTQKQFDAALKTITDQKIEWEKQKLIVDALPGTLTNVNGILKTQEAAVLAIAKAWGQVASAQGGGSRNATFNAITGTQGGGGSLTEEQRIIADLTDTERRMFGFAKGGLVPKYFAAGGLSKGTDIIPAMLTPGEFVMRKSAVDKFGPMLSAINDPSFKIPKSSSYSGASSGMNSVVDNSSAMYNYNIGITVPQSNANPNDIANAVIGQIKYIDAQRVRGQK